MHDYLLGLDFGTGGAKACIIDEKADVLAYAFREYPILTDHPGWSEHEPARYWETACSLIRSCLADSGVPADRIRCIGTSAALPSLVMVDASGEPVHRAYNLMDRRATGEVRRLKEEVGEERIFALSGNRIDDHPILVNLLWERNHRPDAFARIDKALTIDGFIRLRLTGAATMHHSAAAFYGVAYNIRTRTFDPDLLAALGLKPSLIPSAFACEAIVGHVTASAAAQTGLVPGTPVCAGQVDFNAGCISGGITREGEINMNLGTCGNFGIIHRDDAFLESMIACAWTIDSEQCFITIPTTTTGGQLLRYLRDTFSPVETAMEALTGTSAYAYLDQEAERIPPGSDGLIMLPYLMGERTPIWDVHARGAVFGLTLSHTKAHLVRAAMESVAYALYDSFRLIRDTGRPVQEPVILNEGGARSRVWRRIITDVLNVPTAVVKSRVGAPFGDAILAGVAAGVFPDYDIARRKTEHVERMEPDPVAHARYMEAFRIYKRLYEHVREDFPLLAGLRTGLGATETAGATEGMATE